MTILYKNILLGIALLTHSILYTIPVESDAAIDCYIARIKKCIIPDIKNETVVTIHEKTLFYLFDQVGKRISIDKALPYLTRARSAYQVLIDQNCTDDAYDKWEQVYSAIAVRCAQTVADCVRIQLLTALEEIDMRLVYWKYQKNHAIRYFFSKSPYQWVIGKNQEHEIADNIALLERRQANLFVILGRLTEHVHAFTHGDYSYEKCYAWIEKLFSVLVCIKNKEQIVVDDNRKFDSIAAQLEEKMKQSLFMYDNSLKTIATTQIPSFVTRNWIMFTALMGAAAYAGYLYEYDTDNFLKKMTSLKVLVDSSVSTIWNDWIKIPLTTFCAEVKKTLKTPDNLADEIIMASNTIESNTANLLAQQNELVFKDTLKDLDIWFDDMKKSGWIYGYELTDEKAIFIRNQIIEGNYHPLKELCDKIWVTNPGLMKMGYISYLTLIGHKFSQIGLKYAQLLDDAVLPVIKKMGLFAGHVCKNNYWTSRFTTLIPVTLIAAGAVKTYQYGTAKDYSAIRFALAEINSVLIESSISLNNHDYGKLVYLVHKLIVKAHYAISTKNNMREDFIADLKKLESKHSSTEIKYKMVQNMFNKYSFLSNDIKIA